MEKNYEREGKSAEAKPTAADEILSQLIQMAHYSESINEKAVKRLNRVCVDEPPRDPKQTTACREFPPLFSEMREQIDAIGKALAAIEDVIHRVDI